MGRTVKRDCVRKDVKKKESPNYRSIETEALLDPYRDKHRN